LTLAAHQTKLIYERPAAFASVLLNDGFPPRKIQPKGRACYSRMGGCFVQIYQEGMSMKTKTLLIPAVLAGVLVPNAVTATSKIVTRTAFIDVTTAGLAQTRAPQKIGPGASRNTQPTI
jgi:hypothetical protein